MDKEIYDKFYEQEKELLAVKGELREARNIIKAQNQFCFTQATQDYLDRVESEAGEPK